MKMRLTRLASLISALLCLVILAGAQPGPAAQSASQAPVPYASVSQLNDMLSQLQQVSQSAQADLSKLRIERWKTDSNVKRQTQANVDSVQRNLKEALPTIVGELQAAPESLPATFKICRNLDALYDVFSSLVESAGAFGPRDDFQSLANDLSGMEKSRRAFADRMESLATAKEAELARLRAQIRSAQAAAAAAPPKKTIVDDTQPEKKPAARSSAKKRAPKPAAKASSASGSSNTTPAQSKPQ